MKEMKKTINYKGKDFLLSFNLNVMEEIQNEYETIDKWGDLVYGNTNDGEPNAKAVKFGFAAMLNEGIEIENDENGTECKPLTLKQVGRMITEIGLHNVADAINDTMAESTRTEEKNE